MINIIIYEINEMFFGVVCCCNRSSKVCSSTLLSSLVLRKIMLSIIIHETKALLDDIKQDFNI